MPRRCRPSSKNTPPARGLRTCTWPCSGRGTGNEPACRRTAQGLGQPRVPTAAGRAGRRQPAAALDGRAPHRQPAPRRGLPRRGGGFGCPRPRYGGQGGVSARQTRRDRSPAAARQLLPRPRLRQQRLFAALPRGKRRPLRYLRAGVSRRKLHPLHRQPCAGIPAVFPARGRV